jgi:hypothetical protein
LVAKTTPTFDATLTDVVAFILAEQTRQMAESEDGKTLRSRGVNVQYSGLGLYLEHECGLDAAARRAFFDTAHEREMLYVKPERSRNGRGSIRVYLWNERPQSTPESREKANAAKAHTIAASVKKARSNAAVKAAIAKISGS